ncbi:hypothetical protein PENTCL1PPCAC_22105 [Pristionchus entomophagus]|uniref:Uncharacterized protein n=1 Tax=Pristionchus entomophagus TaxID=358040 RepID=A0AAV5U081_9BILA|nr:hypothetical protein PENTCL1PPCAC_22105 [Pristionchus entomophagus]
MTVFNANDPKYQSCCCGAHVTTLARVFVILGVVGSMLDLLILSMHWEHILSNLFACLGAVAIFKEMRGLILVYIALSAIASILDMFDIMTDTYANPKYKDVKQFVVPFMAVLCLIIAVIEFIVYRVYWNLARFIKDRENAPELPVVYQE